MSASSADPKPEHTDADILLYRLQACPYCERVVRKLNDLGLDYHSRFVEPMHAERDAVKRVVGMRTVPAIIDDETGVAMAESANIVKYLEETYGEGAGDGGEN
ncbi:glutaredoxin family protein [Halospeciosus flavus]|uniref:Glutaredoxin family protein n=1 Tax=Halospeciosus flavus TaxID=3032283 RepID=A0ABD5Z720_9EURY|nr:glutathione S-transferase N-terminal domain-containing protein [Halospeciosus flavus]